MPTRRLSCLVLLAIATACSSDGTPTPPDEPTVTSVDVSPDARTIVVGSTTTLTATPRDADGQPISGETIEWSSGNTAIATVSAAGTVQGVSPGGPVAISARASGRTGTAQITVTPVPVETVIVTAPQTTVPAGSSVQLTAETRAAGGEVLTGRTVTWSTSDESIATVSDAGLVTAIAPGGPVTVTASSEGRAGTAAITVELPPLAEGWLYRRPITITADMSAADEHYSVPVVFDHEALVAAGKSLASGDDVRIGYWSGTAWVELDRVLDPGSAWNTDATRIWFRIEDPIAAGAVDESYHLHYGNPAAPSDPPNDPDLVFLFSDDFEDGTLARWDDRGDGTWRNVDTRAHRGTRAMWHGPEGAQGRRITADPALDLRDVMVDAWWNVTSLDPDFNSSQVPRRRDGVGHYNTLLCLCIGSDLGFNVASFLNGTYTDILLPAGDPQANTWMRLGTAMHGDTYRVFLDGDLLHTQDGLDAITSGNIGFDKFVIPSGEGLWLDDVVVRRFVFPEPEVALGPET